MVYSRGIESLEHELFRIIYMKKLNNILIFQWQKNDETIIILVETWIYRNLLVLTWDPN